MMTKSDFFGNIDKEQQRITARCTAIDDAIGRLEDERRLLNERNESIETVRGLYLRTEMSLQEIRQARSDLKRNGSASNGSVSKEPIPEEVISEDQLLSQADLTNH